MDFFLYGKTLSQLWQICDIIGLIFIVANGQILKNNLAICSHLITDNNDYVYLNFGKELIERYYVISTTDSSPY